MRIRPLTIAQANEYIHQYHRHHKPVVGHRYSLGVWEGDILLGVVVVGRPVARKIDPYSVAEVSRLCTNGAKNACSFLYAAAARVAKEMGFDKIQTYILDTESGISLKAAGWVKEADSPGGQWVHTAGLRRTDQPTNPKQRWAKYFS